MKGRNNRQGKTMNRKEKAAINRLQKLADWWPVGLAMFAEGGTVQIYREGTREIIGSVSMNIDGGDWGTIERDGKEFLPE